MKRQVDTEANKRNIPNITLYTKLIGIAYISMVLNCFLTYIYARFFVKLEASFAILMIAIVFLFLTPVVTKDSRKSERGLGAVLRNWLMCSVITMTAVIVGGIYWLLGAFLVEIMIAVAITISYFKTTNR